VRLEFWAAAGLTILEVWSLEFGEQPLSNSLHSADQSAAYTQQHSAVFTQEAFCLEFWPLGTGSRLSTVFT